MQKLLSSKKFSKIEYTSHPNIKKPLKILVVGQTFTLGVLTPPYYGQSLMTQRLVQAELKGIETFLVRMAFSNSIRSVGKFGIQKVAHLFEIVFASIALKLKYNINTIYYMPVGNSFVPLMRDIFLLGILRLFFRKSIFHFRAAGVGEFVDRQSKIIKYLGRKVYHNPDVAIHLSSLNPDDGGYFQAKRVEIIPNGLEDSATPYLPIQRNHTGPVKLLYVGVIRESKGVMVLLEAMSLLKKERVPVRLHLVGGFESDDFHRKTKAYIEENQLEEIIHFEGVKKGEEKWEHYLTADIFCFPSFFESESFGNVLVEAMMFELPIVATRWRGIPDIVEEGENGFLVSIKNPQQLSRKLFVLIQNKRLRISMGNKGRIAYESKYQLSSFLEKMTHKLSIITN